MKKLLAFVGKICPFCILKRKNPDSTYCLVMNKIETYCPFCNAYNQIYGDPKSKAEQQPKSG